MTDAHDYAGDGPAWVHRRLKVDKLAPRCWDLGITGDDIRSLLVGAEHGHADDRRRLRRLAMAAGVNPPRPGSAETWTAVAALLDEKQAWADQHPGDPRADRPFAAERGKYLPAPLVQIDDSQPDWPAAIIITPPPTRTVAPGEQDALFPDLPHTDPEPELSTDQRRTLKQRHTIDTGGHPLTFVALSVRRHPDTIGVTYTIADAPLLPLRCGTCRFRKQWRPGQNTYPKCSFGADPDHGWPRATHGPASDVRAWWPACTDYQPRTDEDDD